MNRGRVARTIACLCVLLATGCFSRATLPPLPSGNALTVVDVRSAKERIPRFESASGLVTLHLDERMPTGGVTRQELRFGFFANGAGALRLEWYPSHGFVSVASALISPSRITAIDKLKKQGIDSELVAQTFEQMAGLPAEAVDIIVALTGKMPAQSLPAFVSGAAADDGSVVLRDARQQRELVIVHREIARARILSRDGTLVEVFPPRAPDSESNDAFGGEVTVTDGHGRVQLTGQFEISNRSFTRSIAPKMFSLDTSGYQMRTRLK